MTSEVQFFKTRLGVLTKGPNREEAISVYENILTSVNANEKFTYTGVKDTGRVDSFFDPFGNITIKDRLKIELARENYKLNNLTEVEAIKKTLFESEYLTVFQSKQLEVY